MTNNTTDDLVARAALSALPDQRVMREALENIRLASGPRNHPALCIIYDMADAALEASPPAKATTQYDERDLAHWLAWSDIELVERAAAACHRSDLDDEATRDAIIRHIIEPFRQALAEAAALIKKHRAVEQRWHDAYNITHDQATANGEQLNRIRAAVEVTGVNVRRVEQILLEQFAVCAEDAEGIARAILIAITGKVEG